MLVDGRRPALQESDPSSAADRARHRARRVGWPAAAIALTIGSRLVASSDRRAYVLWPDEPAQLAFARFVAGGARWNMHDHSTWKPGYGLLVGLLGWGTTDATDMYRVAMVTNALLAGVAAGVLYALTRRVTAFGRRGAAVAAVGAMMLPGSLFITNFAWSEPLTVATLLGSVLAMIAFDAQPTLARGLLAGAVAGAGFASHTRLLPLLVLVVALACIARRRRRLPRGELTAIAAWCGALFVAVTWASRVLVDRLWDEPFERNSYGGVASQLAHLHEAVVAMIGQAWYLAVSTCGLAVIGTIGLISTARSPGRVGRPVERARAARIALAAVGAEFALAGVFMAGRWRGDHVVYGRYNDAFAAVLVVVGLWHAWQHSRRGTLWRPALAAAGLIATSWFALDALRGRQLAEGGVVDLMVLGLHAFGGEDATVPLGSITIAAIAILVGVTVMVQLAGRRPASMLLGSVAALLLWVGVQNTSEVLRMGWTDVRDEPALAALGRVDELDAVAYYLPEGSSATGQMMRYQSVLPRTRFTVVHQLGGSLRADGVFAPEHSPVLDGGGYRRVWSDPSHDVALWRRAGQLDQHLGSDLAEDRLLVVEVGVEGPGRHTGRLWVSPSVAGAGLGIRRHVQVRARPRVRCRRGVVPRTRLKATVRAKGLA